MRGQETVTATAPVRPAHRPGVQEYRLGEELLLYVPECDAAHVLNPSAAAIWELCDGTRGVQEIGQELVASIGLRDSALLPDVVHGVAQLWELGLLEPR
jgi:hypothetical protein